MAQAANGPRGEYHKYPRILARAVMFWPAFLLLGLFSVHAIDRIVGKFTDRVALAVPGDEQLAGPWVRGGLSLHNALHGDMLIVEVWRNYPSQRRARTFFLHKGAAQGFFGLRHQFVGGGLILSQSGATATLTTPSAAGLSGQTLTFSRAR